MVVISEFQEGCWVMKIQRISFQLNMILMGISIKYYLLFCRKNLHKLWMELLKKVIFMRDPQSLKHQTSPHKYSHTSHKTFI